MFVIGDVPVDSTVPLPFDTYDSNGASVTITGLAVTDIEVYKDGSVTQRASDNGYTLLDTDGIDFDGSTGLHGFSIDLSDNSDAGFYAAGSFYWVHVNAITVDSQTVKFTYWLSIGSNLRPTTAGRTLDVTATGAAGIDWGNVENPTTAVDLSGTDIQLCDTTTTVTNDVGVNKWNGVSLATTNPLPNAAAGAENGLGVLDASLLLWTEPQQIAAAAINAAAFDTGAITATAIAASALDGKGDWSLASAVAAISTTLGTNGDNLGSIPWNNSWDAEVQSECNDAITAYGVATAAALATVDTVVDGLATTLGTAGAGLTDLGGMSTAMKAEVLAEVNSAIDTAISELGVGAPTATPTLRTGMMLMYMALRNKLVVQTSGTDALEIYNDAGTKIASKTLTDDGSDYTEAEMS